MNDDIYFTPEDITETAEDFREELFSPTREQLELETCRSLWEFEKTKAKEYPLNGVKCDEDGLVIHEPPNSYEENDYYDIGVLELDRIPQHSLQDIISVQLASIIPDEEDILQIDMYELLDNLKISTEHAAEYFAGKYNTDPDETLELFDLIQKSCLDGGKNA
jgi:hypothetical protein